jgi:hypothetical protein
VLPAVEASVVEVALGVKEQLNVAVSDTAAVLLPGMVSEVAVEAYVPVYPLKT